MDVERLARELAGAAEREAAKVSARGRVEGALSWDQLTRQHRRYYRVVARRALELLGPKEKDHA